MHDELVWTIIIFNVPKPESFSSFYFVFREKYEKNESQNEDSFGKGSD